MRKRNRDRDDSRQKQDKQSENYPVFFFTHDYKLQLKSFRTEEKEPGQTGNKTAKSILLLVLDFKKTPEAGDDINTLLSFACMHTHANTHSFLVSCVSF